MKCRENRQHPITMFKLGSPFSRSARILQALMLAALVAPAGAAPVCTMGELFAGNPKYEEPMDRPPDGAGLKANPPLGWRHMMFVGDKMVTSVGPEIWFTDLKGPAVANRLAGLEQQKMRPSMGGPCKAARLSIVNGLAVRSDGSLVGADSEANNLFIVKDPFGAGCSVTMIAGATKRQDTTDGSRPPNAGDRDGPGPEALLRNPTWVAGAGGLAYFIDNDRKIKRIEVDATNSVKTVATLPEGRYYGLIALKDKLYAVANNSTSEGFIVEIDPKTGAVQDVRRGRSDVWLGRGSILLSGLATDGEGLFTTHAGKLLYVTLDGMVTHLAGNGVNFEYERGYDPTTPHNAMELQLVAMDRRNTAGATVFLAYKDGAVYYGAKDLTSYITKISCK